MIPHSVCNQFGFTGILSGELLGQGLINSSYKVTTNSGNAYFLQQINASIFTKPMALQENYVLIEQHLSSHDSLQLPKLIRTTSGELLYYRNGASWRCFEFIANTYSPQTLETPEQAYETARCFGLFTAALHNLNSSQVQTVLPRFHDLSFRFEEFTQALQKALPDTVSGVMNLIEIIKKEQWLVRWFASIKNDGTAFPLRIMHHDCKISNILFDKPTNAVRCPVDLDTTQPGLFFSDIGDMMRTMVPDKDENERNSQSIQFRPQFFNSVTDGYLDAMADYLTAEEKTWLPKAGMVMAYMQAMRFLTDHLNGNVYYKTEYAEQNKDRAANQLQLFYLFQGYVKENVN